MTNSAEMIFCIVNQGYEDKVIEAVNTVGITGGTFLSAHGLSKLEAEKFFGSTIGAEKEMIFIVTKTEKRNEIMKVIKEQAGINTDAQAVLFSLPVTDVAGFIE